MSDFLSLIEANSLTLIVSLPQNDLDLAKAAVDAGADAIKVHLNVDHRASGNCFGSLEEEMNRLEPILALCKESSIPIGVVPGSGSFPRSEIIQARDVGFSFISLYDKDMDPMDLKIDGLYKMVALTNEYQLEWAKVFDDLPIDVLEASIMDPETYGNPFTVREVLKLQSLRNATKKPILVTTQRAIKPEQVEILSEMGMNGIMIGAMVTSDTEEKIYQVTKEFREAIDKVNDEKGGKK